MLKTIWSNSEVRAAAVHARRNPDDLLLFASAASHPETDWPALLAKYAAVGVDHPQIRLTADPLAAMDELEQLGEQDPAEQPGGPAQPSARG